jgi:acetate kinase
LKEKNTVMKILVINAGSSSLKYQLIDADSEKVLAKGLVERIGIPKSALKHSAEGKDKLVVEKDLKDHTEAIKMVLNALVDKEYGVISDMSEIGAVGHRVVHGGEKFSESVELTESVMKAIEENIELAPLHNPANIMGIAACKANLPNVPMVGVFDTAFHQTMPEKAYLYGLPMEAYKQFKIRRYGFHGTSHKFVASRTAKILGKDIKSLRIITCHLGNGASVAAVKYGKVVDTSMGFTPLEGLVMGTRSGDIDPTVVQHLMNKVNMSLDDAIAYLNKKSGVLGLSGISSDFRDIWQAAREGNANAKLALEVFAYRVKKYIGAYTAAMGDVDAIVFTAGLGENDPSIRTMIMEDMGFLGVKIDEKANAERGEEKIISTPDSRVKVMVVPTNEELMIARETYALIKKH